MKLERLMIAITCLQNAIHTLVHSVAQNITFSMDERVCDMDDSRIR